MVMVSKARRPPRKSRDATSQVSGNRILSALSPDDYERLAPHLVETPLLLKQALISAGRPIRDVCFPDSGVCSVLSVMRNGEVAEVCAVGNEGFTGVALFFGETTQPGECMVQVPGKGRLLPASVFRSEIARQGMLHALAGHYVHAAMLDVMQLAACNQLHSLHERASRWLLMTHDRALTDEFQLTHEFLGLMLGVRRASVTLVALELQRAGLIAYRRGRVTILDRKKLEAVSCECYAVTRDNFDRFLGRLSGMSRMSNSNRAGP